MVTNMRRTLSYPSRVEVEVKKSIFIGLACPITSSEQAQDFVRNIRSEYKDAKHHVYAWRTSINGSAQKHSDDGEPQGTAGMPVMDVLVRSGIDDAAIVVVRYFGGILLGTGGLARAYSEAAEKAVQAADPIDLVPALSFSVVVDYAQSDKIRYAFEKQGYVVDTKYEDKPIHRVLCKAEDEAVFRQLCLDMTAGDAVITLEGHAEMNISSGAMRGGSGR
ncbi:MAG: YigZ family protein [Clostridiaceae bacterium]|nr:YigZ family protein [Clostridiaceae bacterium]